MGKRYYTGNASKVVQISKATVGGTLSGEIFTIYVGKVIIATHTDSTTVIADTVAALVAAWNSSTHPFATGITASDSSPDVVLTADTAGVPFEITVNTPGGSATFAITTPTANSGPNVLDLEDNWDGRDTLPGTGDELHFVGGTIPICWGLDGLNAIVFGNIYFHHNYTGKFGLNHQVFATTADGSSVNTTVAEYRPTHLELKSSGHIFIGAGQRLSNAAGPARFNLNTLNQATDIHILATAAASSDTGKHVVSILSASATTNVYIQDGTGGIGLGVDPPGQSVTFGDIEIANSASNTCKVEIGEGVLYDSLISSGTVTIWEGPTGSDVIIVKNGILTTEGDGYDIDDLTIKEGATCYCNHGNVGGTVVSTLDLAGNLNFLGSREARVVDSLTLRKGYTLKADLDVMTFTAVDIAGEEWAAA